jgi:hypothetical protein
MRSDVHRRRNEDLDDRLVKIVAGIVVAAMVIGGVRWFRATQAPLINGGTPATTFDDARCENAKRFRDSEYRRLGNRRTYAIIRQLDDYVYEACKRT